MMWSMAWRPRSGWLVVVTATALAAGTAAYVIALPSGIRVLRNAAALGTLVRIDPESGFAEFRVSCGWYYTPRKKVRPGVWRVDLRHLDFGSASNLANLAQSHVQSVPLKKWQEDAKQRGWSGTLRLSDGGGGLSNGPTTDICAGVLG
jgi:hypothetical protein